MSLSLLNAQHDYAETDKHFLLYLPEQWAHPKWILCGSHILFLFPYPCSYIHIAPTLLSWYLNEWFCLFESFKCYECKGYTRPGEMILKQPRDWSDFEDSYYLLPAFDLLKQIACGAVMFAFYNTIAQKCIPCLPPFCTACLDSPPLPLLLSRFRTTHLFSFKHQLSHGGSVHEGSVQGG